jgi:hypothetical protein
MPTESINPKKWGNCVWKSLRWIINSYPQTATADDQARFRAYFAALGRVLPCVNCQEHYQQQIAENPIRLGGREELLQWAYEMYRGSTPELANTTYAEFLARTDDERTDCVQGQMPLTWMCVAGVILLVAIAAAAAYYVR